LRIWQVDPCPRALGIEVPSGLLCVADEAIERFKNVRVQGLCEMSSGGEFELPQPSGGRHQRRRHRWSRGASRSQAAPDRQAVTALHRIQPAVKVIFSRRARYLPVPTKPFSLLHEMPLKQFESIELIVKSDQEVAMNAIVAKALMHEAAKAEADVRFLTVALFCGAGFIATVCIAFLGFDVGTGFF